MLSRCSDEAGLQVIYKRGSQLRSECKASGRQRAGMTARGRLRAETGNATIRSRTSTGRAAAAVQRQRTTMRVSLRVVIESIEKRTFKISRAHTDTNARASRIRFAYRVRDRRRTSDLTAARQLWFLSRNIIFLCSALSAISTYVLRTAPHCVWVSTARAPRRAAAAVPRGPGVRRRWPAGHDLHVTLISHSTRVLPIGPTCSPPAGFCHVTLV